MKASKLVLVLALIAMVVVPPWRQAVSSAVQAAVMKSGVIDASSERETNADRFDFDFRLRDLKGNAVDFNTFKGKVVFLNLWATWCGPCRSEMPSIQKLYDDSDHSKIAFVMLSIDEARLVEKVKRYTEEKQFNFPVYMSSGPLTSQLNVDVIPTTFVIDKSGAIALKEIGMKNYNTAKFKKFLEKLTDH
ncbi:MAG TPA: TlpA disulfide reductase family protein [Cyclobacteriaceae bacterium]|jgi:thiol-disulfide isomerase/thioredoxin|nr:TlpA disulfide reductase family protein [Cyclobacteriaceae bacterium]